MSPDGRRLAAVVDGLEGMELRIYDLSTGEHLLLARAPEIRQPVWSPNGDRVLFTAGDSLFVGDPHGSADPELLAATRDGFEALTWSSENRVTGGAWNTHQSVALDPTSRPVTWDTLASDASFPSASPDGRWLVYNDPALNTIWLAPLPPNGRRYQVAPGSEPLWLSNHEIVFGTSAGVVRATIDASSGAPAFARHAWVQLPDFVDTAGQSTQLTPDGRLLYVRTVRAQPKRFLRVVPDWVRQMKRAVDEANP